MARSSLYSIQSQMEDSPLFTGNKPKKSKYVFGRLLAETIMVGDSVKLMLLVVASRVG